MFKLLLKHFFMALLLSFFIVGCSKSNSTEDTPTDTNVSETPLPIIEDKNETNTDDNISDVIHSEEINTTTNIPEPETINKPIKDNNITRPETKAIVLNPFMKQYEDIIANDATIVNYDQKRFAIVTGIVEAKDGSPLQGVRIMVKDYPQYGSALTNETGRYELAIEANGTMIMDFSKEGYTALHRHVETTWNDITISETITLLQRDQKSTQINLNSTTLQIHESSLITTDAGTRSATVIFDGVTSATIHNVDGSQQTLENFTLRATEYETPESMPAPLPVWSEFTYCVDLSIDGVDNNAKVFFDNNVTVYVDNFIGIPTGVSVPVGYYDRTMGQWVAMRNGVIVTLLDTNGDSIVDALDVDDDGTPDDLDGNGDIHNDANGLQNKNRYKPGQTYTRFQTEHFSSIDPNYNFHLDGGKKDDEDPYDDKDNDCGDPYNSYIQPQNRTFHEDISIAGSDIKLWYNSEYTKGYQYKISMTIKPFSQYTGMAIVMLDIAGKQYVKKFYGSNTAKEHRVDFIWDRKNYRNDWVTTPTKATIRVKYTYINGYRYTNGQLSAIKFSFGEIDGTEYNMYGVTYGVRTRTKKELVLPGSDTLVNGWSFENVISNFSNLSDKDTSIWKVSFQYSNFPDYIDGTGRPYVFPGSISWSGALSGFTGEIAVSKLGDFFSVKHATVYKRSRTMKTFVPYAGGGSITDNTYNGIATDIALGSHIKLATDDWGNLYIADTDKHRILKVSTNGHIRTLIGTGMSGDSNGASIESQINQPTAMAIDNKSNLYFIDSGNKKIKKLDLTGQVTTVIGENQSSNEHTGDGALAINATMPLPTHLACDKDGNLFVGFTTSSMRDATKKIRMIDSKGIITSIAGSPTGKLYHQQTSPYGIGVESNINLFLPLHKMFVDPKNRLHAGPYTIYQESLDNIEELPNGEYKLVSSNITQYFNQAKQHIKTVNNETNQTLYTITYTDFKKPKTITDRFGKTVTIEYNNEIPTAIVGPHGEQHELAIDTNHNLISITYPDGGIQKFEYDQNDLMTKMTEPEGNSFLHVYNDIGRITEFSDEERGRWKYNKQYLENGDREVTLTTATGEVRKTIFSNTNFFTITKQTYTPDGSLKEVMLSDNKTTIKECGKRTDLVYGTNIISNKKILLSSSSSLPGGKSLTYQIDQSVELNDVNETLKQIKTITQKSGRTILSSSHSIQNFETNTIEYVSAENRKTLSTYNPISLQTTKIETAEITPITISYTADGKAASLTQGTREEKFIYDNNGDMVTYINSEGIPTHYRYDVMHRLIEERRNDGITIDYSYDKNGNQTRITTPNDADFTNRFNKTNALSQSLSPLQRATTYDYDADRRLQKITRPSGKTVAYLYADGHLEKMLADGTPTLYRYGCGSQLLGISKEQESISFEYDGDLLLMIDYNGTLDESIALTYNNQWLPNSITYAGATQHLGYDKDKLLTRSGNTTLTYSNTNTQLLFKETGDLKTTYRYNDYGEVRKQESTFRGRLVYSDTVIERSAGGKIVKKLEHFKNQKPQVSNYRYDSNGRLIEVQSNGVTTETYTYDANGNRIESTSTLRGMKHQQAYYNREDQLEVVGESTYEYNKDGYLHVKTTPTDSTTYNYGVMGELKEVSIYNPAQNTTKTITYRHNANNQRVAKLINGDIVEKYLWLNLTTLLATYDKDDNLITRYTYANERVPSSMTHNNQTYHLLYNHQGSLRGVIDRDGNIVKEITYDSFGNILSDNNTTLNIPFGFAGGLYDQDTKLTRFGYRDYDAETGKWTAKDLIGFNGGDTNLYGYVLNDPVNFVDPEGLQKYNVTKPESHNGGRNHVHWGSKNSPRDNAVNQDGSTRHGKNPPSKVKDIINKKFGWDLKTPLINLLPFETYEQCVEWQMCGENGCNL